MAAYSDILFAKIALGNRLITASQVQQALTALEQAPGRALGDLLIHRGLITREQSQRVQRAQALTQFVRAERIYAKIVVERKLVPPNVLRECFAQQEQSQHKARLGQLLVDRRVLTAAQNDEVVEEQLVRLAEETARIEEAGLAAELGDSDDQAGLVGLTQVRAATDLEGATFKKAVGPRGLLEGGGDKPPSNPSNAPASRLEGSRSPARQQPAKAPAPAAPSPGADALVGRTIASRYRVLEKVGEGGMGTVYRAEHCLMEKTVALKILHSSLVSSKASLERFRREIRAASKFQHKHVIQIYDAGEGEGGLFYMAMEFAAGESLEDRIRRSHRLSLFDATTLMRQTLGAVAEAHKKGIVHRDLKSANIMIVKGKEGEDQVKVMDFGIAKMVLESGEGPVEGGASGSLYKTQEGVVTGTPQYMSPEQCSGEAVDARSDLYSLGVILFEMLTGELPFKSNTPMGFLGKHIVEPPPPPTTLRPDIPPPLEAVVLRLLEKRPADRYASAEEVLTALDGRGAQGPRASAPAAPRPATPSPDVRSDVRPPPSPANPPPVGNLMRTIDVEEPQTIAVGAPSPFAASNGASGGPTFATSAVNSALAAQAMAAPPQVAAPAHKGTSAPVVVGLVLLLLFIATASTLVAIVVTTPDADPVAQARELLAKDDAAGAIALLEAPAAAGSAPAIELLRDAQRRKGDLDKGDKLADDAAALERAWRKGQRLADGEEAAKLLELALGQKDDAAWRARREVLLAELTEARTKAPGPQTETPRPQTEPPRPPRTETPAPPRTETEPPRPPSTEPPRPPQTEQPDAVAQGRAALDEVNAAIVRGALAEADAALTRAAGLLPADHRDLEIARRALEAAHLVADARAARAADPARAQALLTEALAAQPDKQAQAAIKAELAEVTAEAQRLAASAEGQAALDAALGRSLAAALELDLPAATKAAEEAKGLAKRLGAEGLARPRASSVAALAPLAADLVAARDGLRALLVTPAPAGLTAGKVQAACTRLSEGVAKLAGLPADAPLVDGLRRSFEADLARGRDLAKALEAAASAPPPAKDERLQRFLDMLERTRAVPADEVETARTAGERLERLRQLKEHPAYTKGLAAAADKAWVDEQLAQAVRRKAVWDELGPGMVAVPGGPWRAPGAAADVALPAPYYYAGDAEVTCTEWDAFCKATGRARPQGFPGRTDDPVRLISLADATAYCAWRSKDKKRVTFRLPTEVEWERAARGRSGREFPWGDQFEDWRKDYAAVTGQLLRVKSFERDRNDLGLYDLVGNVAELTSSKRGEQLVVRGGSMSSERKSSGASSATAVKKGDEVSPTIGLRIFAVEK